MPSLVFPSMVRSQVLEQHVELRALLEHVKGASASPDTVTGEPDPDRLITAARELHRRFIAHLAFERAVLTPVFAVLDAWGPERVQQLEGEHSAQREHLDALLARFDSGANVRELSVALRDLAEELLADMEEEELGCLRASLLSADSLTCERR